MNENKNDSSKKTGIDIVEPKYIMYKLDLHIKSEIETCLSAVL